jgi:hypothetical protein
VRGSGMGKVGRSWTQTGWTLLALALMAGLVALAGGAAPAWNEGREISAARAELVRFAGRQPDRCVYSAPHRELCRWRLEGRLIQPGQVDPGGLPGGVNLICDVPIDHRSQAAAECAAFARKAGAFPSLPGAEGLPPVSARPAPPARVDPAEAARRIAGARSLRDLSHLVGDVPNDCLTGRGVQTCRWRIAEDAAGHGIFAAGAGAVGALELRCRLPIDGSGRPAESCRVTPTP